MELRGAGRGLGGVNERLLKEVIFLLSNCVIFYLIILTLFILAAGKLKVKFGTRLLKGYRIWDLI